MGSMNRRLSVAPMMDCTDRHCRYFHRQLSRRALLYSEMIVDRAIIFGERQRFLRFNPIEHPIAFVELVFGRTPSNKLSTAFSTYFILTFSGFLELSSIAPIYLTILP